MAGLGSRKLIFGGGAASTLRFGMLEGLRKFNVEALILAYIIAQRSMLCGLSRTFSAPARLLSLLPWSLC
jgi:hypothetical protein